MYRGQVFEGDLEKCHKQKEIMDLSDLATSPSPEQPNPVAVSLGRKGRLARARTTSASSDSHSEALRQVCQSKADALGLGNYLSRQCIFPGVNVMSNHLDEHHLPVDSAAFYSIANRKLVV
jgi:hypothetical protein